jgi:glucose/arabinose dehydrogenase
MFVLRQFGLLFLFLWTAVAQTSCSVTLTASYPTPSVAAGFSARLIANGLTAPRGIIFDSQGHLLVVEQGSGIVALSLTDDGGDCLSVASKGTVVNDTSVCLMYNLDTLIKELD